ncbi:phosphodiesterase 5A cGMP-specific [Cricetulus griseus]
MERAGPSSERPRQQRDQDWVEAWLDDHRDFTFSYFVRKATRGWSPATGALGQRPSSSWCWPPEPGGRLSPGGDGGRAGGDSPVRGRHSARRCPPGGDATRGPQPATHSEEAAGAVGEPAEHPRNSSGPQSLPSLPSEEFGNERPTFAMLPFGDKTREMVNAWFSERVHNIPICKEGIRAHTESCSCSSQQSPHADNTTPGAPARKISASEFDRPLRPIVVKDSEGTVSFLSDSGKKEQMPLTPRRFDSDEGDQCSRLLELVKDISSHLDVTALCHKIFLHIHGLISADRYSLFLVCEDSSKDKFLVSRLFDVAEGSTLEEASNNCIRLEWNKGIVGHVAAFGEPLNIKDAYEVVGVAQAINKKSGNGGTFTEKDEKDFAAYLAFCGIVLHNAQLYETSLLENKRNQVLLDLASLIFEEQQSLEVILKKIAATIISFMQVQKCTIFIVDEDCSDSFSSVFHMECEELGKSADTLTREHDANKINYMYAQYVKNTMEPLNIPDVAKDKRFPWTRRKPYDGLPSWFTVLFHFLLFIKAAVVPSAQTLKITDFSFSDFELSDVETALCTIRMFTDLNLVQNFQMKHESMEKNGGLWRGVYHLTFMLFNSFVSEDNRHLKALSFSIPEVNEGSNHYARKVDFDRKEQSAGGPWRRTGVCGEEQGSVEKNRGPWRRTEVRGEQWSSLEKNRALWRRMGSMKREAHTTETMAFDGNWKVDRSDNYDKFMEKMGVNVVKRKLAAHDNLKLTITQDGNKFTVKESSTFRNIDIVFELGVNFTYSLADGTELNGTWSLDGNKLIGQFKRVDNGKELIAIREISGGELIQKLSRRTESAFPEAHTTETMAFDGSWKVDRNENYDNFMEKMGINLVKRKLAAHDNLKLTIKQEGNKFTIKESCRFRNIDVVFELGVNFDYTLADGTELNGTWSLEGNKLIAKFKRVDNGKELIDICEISGGELIQTYIYEGVEAKRIFKKE